MSALIASLGPWNWIILGGILLAIEVMAPGTFILWLGLSAILVGVISFAIDWSWQAQGVAFAVLAAIQLVASGLGAAQPTAGAGRGPPPSLMDRPTEIALALSACPASVAGKAAVYVLERTGYVRVRDSENGFTAIVQHSLPSSQEPQCMDAEGTRTLLPRMLKVAELRAQGKNPDEIKRYVADGFANGRFQPPSRPGVDYMLSTKNQVQTPTGTTQIWAWRARPALTAVFPGPQPLSPPRALPRHSLSFPSACTRDRRTTPLRQHRSMTANKEPEDYE